MEGSGFKPQGRQNTVLGQLQRTTEVPLSKAPDTGLCNELATPSRVSLPPQRQLRTAGTSFTWLDSGRNSLTQRSSLIFDRRWTETFFLLLPASCVPREHRTALAGRPQALKTPSDVLCFNLTPLSYSLSLVGGNIYTSLINSTNFSLRETGLG